MKSVLILAILTTSAWAQNTAIRDVSEEALILNQELQFLEDSANEVSALNARPSETEVVVTEERSSGLEDIYFSSEEREGEDRVKTQTAAPNRPKSKRRRQ